LNRRASETQTYILSLISVVLVVAMVLYPEVAFAAAVKGLDVWWNVVFPALLPFFIGAQLLMGLGGVHFMGVLLEPLMRPVFNVPGAGAFVMAMGLASGYPIGSVLTAQLRRQAVVTRAEAERLMSFTNTADPLFMSGAVAVGMFANAGLSGVIMVSHYISTVFTGLVLRFYAPRAPISEAPPTTKALLPRALDRMIEARNEDGRPFGELMGDCVTTSVNTLLLIGGFIILFSVVIKILTAVGFVRLMSAFFASALARVGVDIDTSAALVSGFFEITLGTQLAAQVAAPLKHQVIVASAIIAWSGLSVHAQVAAMVQGTDITMTPYIMSRLFHAVLAGICTAVLWPVLGTTTAAAFFSQYVGARLAHVSFLSSLGFSTRLFLAIVAGISVLTLGVYVVRLLCNLFISGWDVFRRCRNL